MIRYVVGSTIRLEARFSDPNARAIRLRVKLPNGNVTEYIHGRHPQLVKDGDAYVCNVPASLPGVHVYRWQSEGPTAAAAEDRYVVEKSAIA